MKIESAMIVSDLSQGEVKRLVEVYDFQIRDALRCMKKAPTIVEAKIALKAANAAKARKQWLLEHTDFVPMLTDKVA